MRDEPARPDETNPPGGRPVLHGPAPGLSWPAGVVHIWRFPLEVPDDSLARYEPTLSDDERARADRFRGEGLRRRFVAGRGGLRAVLASYLGLDPGAVTFAYEGRGKPTLGRPRWLDFNLAHSGGRALLAVTSGRAVGVDVEELRPMDNAERIIDRFFTPAEQADFLSHPAAERPEAFFRGWTRKEAFLKATGVGLGAPLDSFEVSLARATGNDPGRSLLLTVGGDPAAAAPWTLCDVDAGPGYLGALAVSGAVAEVVVRDWPV